MTATQQSTDETDRSTGDAVRAVLGLWKTWAIALGSTAIALYAFTRPELTPGGYVPIFLAFAAAAVLYGVQRLDFAPDPV